MMKFLLDKECEKVDLVGIFGQDSLNYEIINNELNQKEKGEIEYTKLLLIGSFL